MMPGRPVTQQAVAPKATQWQPTAQLAGQALPPAKARGVSADPAAAKFVLPSPEALGVSVSLSPAPATNTLVDWNLIQARMERLAVLHYEKDRSQPGRVRVRMLLPTSDPTRAQPVEAQAESEAAAIVMALDAAEAWARKR